MPPKVSFIHTADLHLGKSFQELGNHGSKLRHHIIAALNRGVEVARDRAVDLFLIAGDLFDSTAPSREALSVLEAAFARLSESGIRAVVIPGTHDPAGSRAFSSPILYSRPRQVFVITPEEPVRIFEDLDLAVGAWFPLRGRAREWTGPPRGWGRDRTFRVAMAHGSALPAMGDEGPEDLLPEFLLHDPEIHYLALGHHHGARPVDEAVMPAYYSGSPEMLAMDQKEAGYVLHVVLDAGGKQIRAAVDKVRVGSLRYLKLRLDAAEVAAGRDLNREIERAADPDLFFEVALEGTAALDAMVPDPAELERRYAPAFFRLKIIDRTTRGPELSAVANIPEASVLAEFIRRLQERISEASGPEREEWEEALRLGVQYLVGSDREP